MPRIICNGFTQNSYIIIDSQIFHKQEQATGGYKVRGNGPILMVHTSANHSAWCWGPSRVASKLPVKIASCDKSLLL